MARRNQGDADDVSLDSLLDTMTNVVAILVILLIVTQLGVSDAVKRIAATNPVDPEKIADAKKSIERNQRRLETLKALASSTPESPEEIQFKLKNTNDQIEATGKRIAELEKENKSLLLMATAETDQKAKQKDLDTLNEEIQKRLAEIQKADAQLQKIPIVSDIPTKVVNLPNPRPAPRGAKPFLMMIKNQKVYPLDLDKFRQQAKAKAAQIVERAKLNRDPAKGIDATKFLTLFNRQKLRDAFFEVSMKANGTTPVLVFQPLARKGYPQKVLTNKNGPFWKSLIATDPNKFYVSFLVWSESFEVYITTRMACAEVGLAAGWSPQTTTRPFERVLGGTLRFGPAPPPPPKPDPNKKGGAAPPPQKPLPVDTID